MSNILHQSPLIVVIYILTFSCFTLSAKSYKFRFGNPESKVTAAISTQPGTKMVEVVACAGSADKAIDRACLDAAVDAVFNGITGNVNIDNIPPVLIDGEDQYKSHKKFFDKFFKKGEFIKYVHRANSTYPSGTNNVSSPQGRKVKIYMIIDYKNLEQYLKSQGFKTLSSLFD